MCEQDDVEWWLPGSWVIVSVLADEEPLQLTPPNPTGSEEVAQEACQLWGFKRFLEE